ncbi:MAG: hypothetical protein IPM29_28315 [Planctomycetes bacterium]|nr:hypothetical protein [Planctomycetota bacterium]
MHKALSLLIAGAFGATLPAQITDPCGPAVVGAPAAFTDFTAANFGATEVGQVNLVATGGGNFAGTATIKKTGATDWDIITFTWAGPGNAPVTNTDADALNGTTDEFQGSLNLTRTAIVMDTGSTNPWGAGAAIIATRAGTSGPFSNAIPMAGVPTGYIDPHLGTIGGRDVIFWADVGTGIKVGDIDTNPSSGSYGVVTNVRDAVLPRTQQSGFNFLHSPSTQRDSTNESVAIYCSSYAASTGSDSVYQSTPDVTLFPSASLTFRLQSYVVYDDGTNWDANPAVIRGSAIYAKATSVYTDPLRINTVTLSSASLPAFTAGTARHVMMFPYQSTSGGNTVLTALNLGISVLPNPIDPNSIGFVGFGFLCVAPVVGLTTGPATNDELVVNIPVPAGIQQGVLLAQGIGVNITNGQVFLSNVAVLELR